MTREGDVVLVHMDNKPAFFARIEEITTDVKAGWYHVKLLVLQVPLLVVTWILREAYYNGQEFTMGGHPMLIETVVAPPETESEEADPIETRRASTKPELVEPKKEGKVISMLDRLKKSEE